MNYDKLKLIGQTIAPAIIACIAAILGELGVEKATTIVFILNALLTCYNSCIVWWNKEYYKTAAIGNDVVEGDSEDVG